MKDVTFTEVQLHIVYKELKYNLHSKPKTWIISLALEADTAIRTLLILLLLLLLLFLWLYGPLLDLGRFFSLLILYTVGRTPWTGDQPVARPLPNHRTAKTENKRTQTSIP
jgi:hypothetical protein